MYIYICATVLYICISFLLLRIMCTTIPKNNIKEYGNLWTRLSWRPTQDCRGP